MNTLTVYVDIRQQDGTVIHASSTPTDSVDLSRLANAGHVTRMIRASLRHQLLTIEAGYTGTVHLNDDEPAQLATIGELSSRLKEINANVETVIGFVAPNRKRVGH